MFQNVNAFCLQFELLHSPIVISFASAKAHINQILKHTILLCNFLQHMPKHTQ